MTVVANAGVSAGNQQVIEGAGLSFILGVRPRPRRAVPGPAVAQSASRSAGPGRPLFIQSWPASATDGRRDQVITHKRESIDAHLAVVFAAIAVGRHIAAITGWSVEKFVPTARRYRALEINAAGHTITAADPPGDDLHEAIRAIHATGPAH